ncbi:MAG: ABC transporter permease subunit [Erysipelotrichaceae bacterium]|nr:ABC transporter permease subunit [Erysipelotrichaceae bacterium]
MKKFITNNYILYSLGIIFVFILWVIFSSTLGGGNLYFPTPIETFKKLGELLSGSYIYLSIGWTLLRTLIGFLASLLAALIFGLLAGSFRSVYIFLKPLMTIFKSLPTAALVFLFLVLSGSRYAPVYIVFLISFPILYESIVGGIKSVPQEINDVLRIDTEGGLVPLMKIKVPIASPYIIVGLASSFALSLKTTIMAEIITGDTGYGLGNAIRAYRSLDPTDLSPIFAISLIAIVIVLIVDLVGLFITKYIEKRK